MIGVGDGVSGSGDGAVDQSAESTETAVMTRHRAIQAAQEPAGATIPTLPGTTASPPMARYRAIAAAAVLALWKR